MFLSGAIACTTPNPRLCKNGGPCPDPAGDLAAPSDLSAAPRDLTSAADLLAPPSDGGLCNTEDRCGPACQPCIGSAHPRCDGVAMRCICSAAGQCGGDKDVCTDGACRRECGILADCATAPSGKACLGALPGRCGCRSDNDCSNGSTCDGDTCRCGVTVCRVGQTCASGACR